MKTKYNDRITTMKYNKIANQLRDEDSGVAQSNYNRKALSQVDDDNDELSEYYDFDD